MFEVYSYRESSNDYLVQKMDETAFKQIAPQECAICLGSFEHEDKSYQVLKTNPCIKPHYFHLHCMKHWSKAEDHIRAKQFSCPTCRADLGSLRLGINTKVVEYQVHLAEKQDANDDVNQTNATADENRVRENKHNSTSRNVSFVEQMAGYFKEWFRQGVIGNIGGSEFDRNE
ncbi:RING finger domain-containing protein [Parashewanella tropica]|uniref:RING finger domain-containing protein n=1 Tax=Parashewanella tropica TaxID=2547970 RepID=UPI0010595C78|nr:RING finger domain-containing protein [Parashewanella tropica]